MGAAREFTLQNFASEVLESAEPVLVDFWAPWCGPCRQLAPLIDQLASEYKGAKIGKLNVDDATDLAQQYQVTSIPTIIIFRNGQPVERFSSVQSKSRLQQALDTARG